MTPCYIKNILPAMVILKFGGSSVSSTKRILTICNIVRQQALNQPIVVVSALSGITDLLISLTNVQKSEQSKIFRQILLTHKKLVNELFETPLLRTKVMVYVQAKLEELKLYLTSKADNPGFSDKVVSFGETLASHIISEALEQSGINSTQVVATKLIVTNRNFGSADFIPKLTEQKVKKTLLPHLKSRIVPVVTGFVGATKRGEVTTLGRGGSDYSASILGYSLKADEIQIWTDVDGVFTADPRVVESARIISNISYREASEMATFGAKVLHPRTLRPAIEKGIPVRVLNTFKPDQPGTLISKEAIRESGLKSIAFKRKTTLINIYSTDMLFSKGYLARIFDIFAEEGISIDLVSVSEVSVSVTLDDHPRINNLITRLREFAEVFHTSSVGMISLIGEDLIQTTHVLTDVSILLHQYKIPIKMLAFGASNINISFVIDSTEVERAVKLIHDQVLIGNKVVNPQRLTSEISGGIKL